MKHWLPPGNIISTERLIHAWLVDGSRTVPAGNQAPLKKLLHWERSNSKVNELSPSPFCSAQLLMEMGSTGDPSLVWSATFLHLSVHGSDLTSQKCKQHHTCPEQSLTSSSITAMSYQAKKPPTVPRTYTKPGDHLTNPLSSPTGGWLLLSKWDALILLS